MLPCESVHGCLYLGTGDRAKGRRAVMPVDVWPRYMLHQCTPESWMGSARLGPLYSQSVWSQFVCFDVFNEFRGVKNGWHGDTPCLRMLPIGYGGCLLRSIQYGGTGAASG